MSHYPYMVWLVEHQETMGRLKEAAARCVPPDQVSTWVSAIESGDEDPILALHLLRHVNVSTLNLSCLGSTNLCLF